MKSNVVQGKDFKFYCHLLQSIIMEHLVLVACLCSQLKTLRNTGHGRIYVLHRNHGVVHAVHSKNSYYRSICLWWFYSQRLYNQNINSWTCRTLHCQPVNKINYVWVFESVHYPQSAQKWNQQKYKKMMWMISQKIACDIEKEKKEIISFVTTETEKFLFLTII